jgi:PAS domain S-box-containing protein
MQDHEKTKEQLIDELNKMRHRVAELETAEEAAWEIGERYRQLIENASDIIFQTNEGGFFTFVNPVALRLTGYPEKEILGKHYTELIRPDHREKAMRFYGRQFVKRLPVTYNEFPLVTKHGMTLWIGQNTQLIMDGETVVGFQSIARDITERKVAEEALKAEKQRFQSLGENSPFGMVMIQPDGTFSYANPKFKEMFGYDLSDVPNGREWFRKAYPDPHYRHEVISIWVEHVKGHAPGEATPQMFSVTCNDGTEKIVHFRPVKLDSDEYMMTCEDITALNKAEEALRASEELYRNFFETSHECVFITTPDGKFIDVNPAGMEMFGYDPQDKEELRLMGVASSYANPEERQDHARVVSERGFSKDFPVDFRKQDGTLFNALVTTICNKDEHGNVIGFSGTIRDITERKRWEQELQNILKRFYAILSTSYAGVMLVTNENTVEFINQAMCDLFDIEDSPDRLQGISASEMIEKLKNAYEQPSETLDRIRQLVSQGMQVKGEEVAVRGGRTYLVDYIPIKIDNKPYGRLWYHIDISERKRAEQEKENLRAQLLQSQKMETMGTLAAGIAHDFNNMLTVILGYSSMLLADKNEKDPGYKGLQKILKTSQDAADLVQRIRIFGRKAEMNLIPLDLNHQINQATKLLSRTLPKMIEMDIHLTKDPVVIKADSSQIAQMVMNLAVNAGEAMPQGGRLSILTENIVLDDDYCRLLMGVKRGPHVMLTVSDTGRGIDKSLMERIFDPFYSTKARDYRKGTGLGLSVVQGIVQQHGGHITVESEVGQGTTFRMYFPALEVEKVPEYVEWKIPYPAGGTETILLVEDMELVRDLVVTILETFGYTVLSACDGQEALDVYEKEQGNIALVILDIIMPRMDGKQCLEQLLRINPTVKVIISSGVGYYDLINEVVEIGAKGAVNKPYSMRQILGMVREVLDGD